MVRHSGAQAVSVPFEHTGCCAVLLLACMKLLSECSLPCWHLAAATWYL